MPEPVSCHAPAPGSSIIECDDVVIGPEPAPERAESHAESAGARALVERHTPPLVLRDSGVRSVPIDGTTLGVVGGAVVCERQVPESAR